MHSLRRAIFAGALLALAAAGTTGASAGGVTVTIVAGPKDSEFTPQTVTISVNDSVTWSNDSPTIHYVAFSGQVPVGVQNNSPFTRVFTVAGTFDYYCTKHPSMTGKVIVQGPPATPASTTTPTPPPPSPPPSPMSTVAPTPAPTFAPTQAPAPPAPPALAPPPSTLPTVQTPAPTPVTPSPAVTGASPSSPEPTTAATTQEGLASDDPTTPPLVLAIAAPPAPSVKPLAAVEEGTAIVDGGAFFGGSPFTWLQLAQVAGVLATTVAFWLFVYGPLRVRRYWFEFDVNVTNGVGRIAWVNRRLVGGCGVSGRSEADCLELIRRTLVEDSELPPVRQVIADVDLSTLSRRVQRAMDFPHERGVWYPSAKSQKPAPASHTAN